MSTETDGDLIKGPTILEEPDKEEDSDGEFYVEIEPSTEHIPDEYEHIDNEKVLVHIFKSKYRTETETIRNKLSLYGYKILDKHIHNIDTRAKVIDQIQHIANKNHKNRTGILLIFLSAVEEKNDTKDGCITPDGKKEKSIDIKEIWSHFLKCQYFRHKPKIILFHVEIIENETQLDGNLISSEDLKYEVPIEADVFIVYKKDRGGGSFINSICKNIEFNGNRDDICDIITLTSDHRNSKRPTIISTLTRKFYISQSGNNKMRGYYFDIEKSYNELNNHIDAINKKLAKIPSTTTTWNTSLPSLVPPSPTTKVTPKERRKSATTAFHFPSIRPRTGSNSKKPWK